MVPAVLIRKSTKEIIKQDIYPREDMQPVEGMDPDYEWLITNIPYEEPVYDSRIFIMQTNLPDLEYLPQFQAHPLYPVLREYRITYNPVKRPNEDIIMAIENAEKEANASIWSEAIHKDETMFIVNAVYKKSENILLTSTEQSHIEKMSSVNVKLAKNLDTKNIKVAQVNAGQEPNIDEGWEKN